MRLDMICIVRKMWSFLRGEGRLSGLIFRFRCRLGPVCLLTLLEKIASAGCTANRRIDGRVAPRSGLANKHGIDTLAGVIDADYRGPVGVILANLSDTDFEVKVGDRIAQLIVEKVSSSGSLSSRGSANISRSSCRKSWLSRS